ncbi:MAG: ATP-binding protein [Nitrospirae bacterium]|nr:ATP-binding protein [Nitrospirota bacterium]
MFADEINRVTIVKKYNQLPLYLCESRAMNQLFYHILLNAFQAIATTGTITIVTSQLSDTDGKNETIQIKIDDDGKGMSDESVKRAFIPFYTTKDVGCGKGLGLSIVDGIVSRHGGRVNLESAEGKGTSITIRLPLMQNRMFSY